MTAVDVSSDPLALGEALLRATPGAGIPLDAWAARVYMDKPGTYTPHFINHPEEVCSQVVVTAYSKADIEAATAHVIRAVETMIKPNTLWECVRGMSKMGSAYVSHIYCYPRTI